MLQASSGHGLSLTDSISCGMEETCCDQAHDLLKACTGHDWIYIPEGYNGCRMDVENQGS